jgi:hypothetical protein
MDVLGAQLKVDRARHHLADLQEQVSRWLAEAPAPRFVVEVEDAGSVLVVRLVDVPRTPAAWSLVLGDALHNLRSALDLLAWQAVIAGGATPGRRTAFPVFRDNHNQRGDKGVTTALRGAPPGLVAAAQGLQPFSRCRPGQMVHGDPLWQLHRLDIEDKHHLLVVCAQVMPTVSYNIPEQAVGCAVISTLQPAHDGAEVLRLTGLSAPVEAAAIDPQGGAYDVWVAETADTSYRAVRDLGALATMVDEVIATFQRHG